jgi:hypothetical protein
MKRKTLAELSPEEKAFIDEGKPKRALEPVAKEGPAAPAQVPTILVAYRWPEPLVKQLMEECHRRKMAGIRPYTQREVTAEALREYLAKQVK